MQHIRWLLLPISWCRLAPRQENWLVEGDIVGVRLRLAGTHIESVTDGDMVAWMGHQIYPLAIKEFDAGPNRCQ